MTNCTLLTWLSLVVLLPTVRLAVVKPKPITCAAVRNLYHTSRNGYFTLYDSISKPYLAFCDFQSDPGFAWTLIESLSTTNARTPKFSTGFYYNVPSSECTPNWSCYRLSKARMVALKNAPSSTHFRATCNFNSQSVKGLQNRRDYLRASFCAVNFFFAVKVNAACVTVDYINVRGHSCRKCSIPFWTSNIWHLHIDLPQAAASCGKFEVPNQVQSEDVFGAYWKVNPFFSCTATSASTTNWWIGGPYLK
ncbi:uncharacterized protein TRIADDRAFT_55274 [Trichoplax adhaerens]|uniref:Fibrinogen C-terminal domain-containing protein n=1 Tax=Trichoplax adhaerens TaxID=10228 RepID=B3RUG0_TRIAD|nr:predicted protein [Trichoplax adhaerens]EDV25806.1 predicted protein [Trichoplax adhaerens]|eukprot:XP_002111839.1 predicted protein [Trichoplax adhaerens]